MQRRTPFSVFMVFETRVFGDDFTLMKIQYQHDKKPSFRNPEVRQAVCVGLIHGNIGLSCLLMHDNFHTFFPGGEKVAKDSLCKKCHKTSQNVKVFAVAFRPCGSLWEERGFY